MTPIIVNEHSRRFPRTLKDAFPVSENYRAAIEGPESMHVERVVDIVCFALSILALVWMAWLGLSLPKPW